MDLRRRLAPLPPRSPERRRLMHETARLYGVSAQTLYRVLRQQGQPHTVTRRADRGVPRVLPQGDLHRYLELIATLTELNTKIDQSISEMLESARLDPQTYSFPTAQITDLDTLELQELIVAASRALQPGIQLDEPLIREIAAFAKNATTGKFRPLRQGVLCVRTRKGVNLTTNVPH